MSATIFAYSGSGNSLWVARSIAQRLSGNVLSLAKARRGEPRCESEAVGLVFPVHMWGLPPPVLDLARRLEVAPGAYLFAVAVNAGQVSRTLVQLEEVLRDRGLTLSAGYSIELPSNYIPFGGPGPKREQEKLFAAAGARVEEIAGVVGRRERGPIEMGPLWQRLLFTPAYRMSLPRLGGFDRSFKADQKCTGCGTCARVCPAGNIELVSGRPEWQHRCEQCYACIEWCPRQAIQTSKRSERVARYHHPEVKLEEAIELAGSDAPKKRAEG